ncbi:aminotransferase class I/II-fold pyridoxal phosphate-dependent enzyme [Desulfobacterales bacterium HSG17]|nr:aminotransferase class I/II-fold pyridoxal phosphate-dependent enzyme [Desulfobacterales bacterium HSG17]
MVESKSHKSNKNNFNPEQSMSEVRREFGEHGGVTPSISRSSTFTVMASNIMPDIFAGLRDTEKDGCFLYSRHFNPTVDVLARYLAALEGSEAAICTASGMAAISCAILQLCRSGDHIVASDTIYGGTHALLADVLPDMGITTTFVDATDADNFVKAATDKTRLFYTETLGNPLLKLTDIPALGKIAKSKNIRLMVDNTFTPMIFSPLAMGADIVIHSLTKFINGASDNLGGAICASRAFIHQLMDLHTGRAMLLGPSMDPRTAYDIIQRLPHLGVRLREHGKRAMAAATLLAEMDVKVTYPGLKQYSQHDLFCQLQNPSFGFGGIFTVDCGDPIKADQLLDILQNKERFGLIAVSLGYYDTLMSCSGTTTSSEISVDEQSRMGLSPGLVRFSIGITGDLDERLAQLERGVRSAGLV